MKQLVVSILIGAVFSSFIRCSGPKVISFTGSNPDFGSYFTYRVKQPGSQGSQEKIDEREKAFFNNVENAINNQMTRRGYENAEVADIVVNYNLILDNEVDYQLNRNSPYSYPYGSYPYNYPYWFEKDEYTKGTLLVELREELTNKLIWQASLDLKYNKRSSSRRNQTPVENAFEIIFSRYPYLAGKNEAQFD